MMLGSTAARALFLLLAIVALAGCSSSETMPPGASGAGQRIDPSQWSGVSARFTDASARFDFRYTGSPDTLYKAHLSTMSDFSWDVYFNFASAPESPMVQDNPHGTWAA